MKKSVLKLITVTTWVAVQFGFAAQAQTVSTFESLLATPNSFWDGSTAPNGTTFNDGNAIFNNFYDGTFGYWTGGWAYSNMQDSTTTGFTNLYSAITASGVNGSSVYAECNYSGVVNLNPTAIGKVVNGCYITNATIAFFSMQDGDGFAKKFGGPTGNDPDWFKVTIRNWFGGVLTNDSVEFYLADYRFTNNAQDYILKTWEWVDLSTLGNVDSLSFALSSSDNGSFGINTPAFFCMDNFTTANSLAGVQNINVENTSLTLFPNPAKENVNIDCSKMSDKNVFLSVTDVTGKTIYKQKINSFELISLNVSAYPSGIYFLTISGENTRINKKFIKE